MKKPKLYLFTASFPYTYAAEGTFLESEVNYLEEKFDVTYVPRIISGKKYEFANKNWTVDSSLANDLWAINFGNIFDKIRLTTTPKVLLRIFSPASISSFFSSLPHSLHPGFISRWIAANASESAGISWLARSSKSIEKNTVILGWWLSPEILGIATGNSKVPVVARAHGTDLYEDRETPPIKPLRKSSIRFMTQIYPCSKQGKEYLVKKYPFLISNVETAYLGTKDFGLNPKKVETDDSLRLVSCSFIDTNKQIDLIIDAFSKLVNEYPEKEIYWTHFGDGDPKLVTEMNLLISNQGLVNAKIRPFPGIEALREYYAEQHVSAFINASKAEGLPVTMMEAASFGIPLIGPNVGGIAEIIRPGLNGMLIDSPITSGELFIALKNFMSLDSSIVEGMREKSKQIWSQQHSAEKVYKEFTNKLEALSQQGEA